MTFLPEKYVSKFNKMPKFYMIFARKMPEFYIIIARKIFYRIFFFGGEGRHMPPALRLLPLCVRGLDSLSTKFVSSRFWTSCCEFVTFEYIVFLFTAQRTLVQSAVLRWHVVRPSVCDVVGLWSHRLEILETNCTDSNLAEHLRSL